MNIIDKIERNFFLKEIFPYGIEGEIFIGSIEFHSSKAISIQIHTKQKPEKEIKKWGIWGKNYNTIAIEVLISFVEKSEVINWQKAKASQINFSHKNNISSISLEGYDWHISFKAEVLTFQKCSVYIDTAEDIEESQPNAQ